MGRSLRRFLVVPVVAALLALALVAPAAAIVYGQPDEGRHPYVGALLYDSDEDGELEQRCTGTLIAPTVFLTAGHCTFSLERQAAVTFDDEVGPGMTLYYGTAHTHPDFGFSGPGGISDPHDIAVILLDEAVPITPASLPRAGLLSRLQASKTLRSTDFTAVGYGAVRETRKGAFGSILRNTQRRFAVQDPLSLTRAWFTLSMNEATGDGGTCYGDSGGPHLLGAADTPSATDVVVSITVTGDAVCKATDKTYRVDTPSARAFLDDFVALP